MVKNLVTVSLMVFVIVVVVVLGFGLLSNQNKIAGVTPTPQQITIQSGTPTPSIAGTSSGITITELAKHNTPSDCWLIVNGKVYNVGSYLNMHPGGPEAITPYCGKDATVAFNTKGGRGAHSKTAQNLLSNFYVGDFIR